MNTTFAERIAAAIAAAAVTFALLIAVVGEAGAAPHERLRLVDAGRGAPCAAGAS